jgi:hypothetical protein
VSTTPVVGAIGISQAGPVTNGGAFPSSGVAAEVRNTTGSSIHIRDVVGTFFEADGDLAKTGIAHPDTTLAAGASMTFSVIGYGETPATNVALSVNAEPVGGLAYSLVAWTNWFHDTGTSPFLPQIAWLAEQGITTGCTATKFCPKAPVSRGEMATFLDRALGLPSTATDYFTDDETSVHEPAINRVRAAQITYGCTATTFCPTSTVTREQMAAFLTRALHLPPTATDYFTDDETSLLEDSINRLRASGITSGCTATTFCPKANVTREQMASFLYRAFH